MGWLKLRPNFRNWMVGGKHTPSMGWLKSAPNVGRCNVSGQRMSCIGSLNSAEKQRLGEYRGQHENAERLVKSLFHALAISMVSFWSDGGHITFPNDVLQRR